MTKIEIGSRWGRRDGGSYVAIVENVEELMDTDGGAALTAQRSCSWSRSQCSDWWMMTSRRGGRRLHCETCGGLKQRPQQRPNDGAHR